MTIWQTGMSALRNGNTLMESEIKVRGLSKEEG